MMQAIELLLKDEAATIQLGEDLALALKPGDCLALSGDLVVPTPGPVSS